MTEVPMVDPEELVTEMLVGSGFIPGSRGPFSMDLVAVAILIVVPVLTTAIILARRRLYRRHKQVQVGLSCVLLLVLAIFEIDVRLHGWQDAAAPSPYFDNLLWPMLYLHLTVAILTTFFWTSTLVLALKRFPKPPRPGPHSVLHRRLGIAAALGMYATSVTGWIFFWMAFVAR